MKKIFHVQNYKGEIERREVRSEDLQVEKIPGLGILRSYEVNYRCKIYGIEDAKSE